MNTIIIGAGASGLMAGISAALQGANVTIIEEQKKPGKKLSVTGNGKCNFTNERIKDTSTDNIRKYYYGDVQFISDVLSRFGVFHTLDAFEKMGVYAYLDVVHGGYYPHSNRAVSVTNALVDYASTLKVKIKPNNLIQTIEKTENGFVVDIGIKLTCDKLILATGGVQNDLPGICGYQIAKKFGHTVSELKPALTALVAKDLLNQASGTRFYGEITILDTGYNFKTFSGEVQITDYGISGIPVFDASHCVESDNLILINFIPKLLKGKTLNDFGNLLYKNLITYNAKRTFYDVLKGMVPEKILQVVFQRLRMPMSQICADVSLKCVTGILGLLSQYPLTVSTRRGFDFAQVTAGGVSTNEVYAFSMESKLCKGLYFAGEILDVDGICGGYNLQWAWSTGFVAGTHVGR